MENEIIKTEETQPVNGAYKQLLTDIGQLIANGRKRVLSAVNTTMLQMYWGIGQHIVEYEQNGELRAQYGKSLLPTISIDLTQLYGSGFNRNNLQYMRKLYMAFPNCTTLSCKLSWSQPLEGITNNLFAARYQLYLPKREDFQARMDYIMQQEDKRKE